MTKAIDDVIATFYRAFSGEPDLLDEVVASDWQDLPLAPGQATGRDGARPLIGAIKEAVPDLLIVVHDVVDGRGPDGDGLVAVRGEMRGTHRGEWFGVPATGREFSIAIHEFHQVNSGVLTRTWHLEDWLGWFQQMGATPAPQEEQR